MTDADMEPSAVLAARLADRIRTDGPLSLAAYMADALLDPRAGYYATRDPLGAGGDFVTAPEISAMFGELVGLWAVQSWREMGRPDPFLLIELGPGRGVMMADMLRAARLDPGFLDAATVVLVEASPALQAVQARTLAEAPVAIEWRGLDAALTAPGPRVLVANEFLDCLPVRQFVRIAGAWRERRVGLDPNDPNRFAYVADAATVAERDAAMIPPPLQAAADGAIVEVRPGLDSMLAPLATGLAAAPGRALFIDYGPGSSESGDTVQALRAHEKVDPLVAPGTADLTARVDFAALTAATEAASRDLDPAPAIAGPVEQGAWLKRLGVEARAASLIRARPSARPAVVGQLARLLNPDQMGALFKAWCVSSAHLPVPAGFADAPAP